MSRAIHVVAELHPGVVAARGLRKVSVLEKPTGPTAGFESVKLDAKRS